MRLKPLGGRIRTAISPRARSPRNTCSGQVCQMPPKSSRQGALMSSLRKIDSARANGAKSHGPITEEGRKKSSMNAIKHGLNARTPVLFNETDDEHAALLDSYVQHLQPVGTAEMAAVIDMVDAKWRQRRLLNIESEMFQRQMGKQKKEVDAAYESYNEVIEHKMNHLARPALVEQASADFARFYLPSRTPPRNAPRLLGT